MTTQEKLQELTKTSNLSAVAKEIGYARGGFYNIVHRPGVSMNLPTAIKIANFFHVSLDWLTDDQQDWPPTYINIKTK